MSRVLHISCSPRGDRSYSTRVAREFVSAYRDAHPDDEIDSLDLFTHDIPDFRAPEAAAKYAVLSGQEPRDEAARAWRPVIDTIRSFMSYDKYVLSTAMWNFSIPYRLKQYIDVLVQPGLTFSFSPATGYTGLVTGKRVALVLARGGAYGEPASAALDFQKAYLQLILGFIGITDVQSIVVEPTLGPEAEKATSTAVSQARAIAAAF